MKIPDLRNKAPQARVVAHCCNLSTQETKARGKWYFQDKPGLHSQMRPACYRVTDFTKKKKKSEGKKEQAPKSQFLTLLKCKPDLCSPF